MIIGAHIIIQSKDANADRAFLNRLAFPFVPMDGGFTIHGLPPSEVAIHSSEKNDVHEFWLMCDDIDDTIREMARAGIAATPIREASWGLMTTLTLPGGGKLGVYEPKHPRPKQHKPGVKKKVAKKKVTKKVAKKKLAKKRRR
jgi:hypothetical protein